MESSRKAYSLEQYRHGVLHTETPNPTASAMPARALDTTPQSAGRRFYINSVLVNTTHAYTPAPLARQLESPVPTQYSNAPIARDPTEPILQPARLSSTSTKHPRTPRQPPNLRPPPPTTPLPNVCTTLCKRHPPDQFYFRHSFSTAQHSKINTRYADTPPPCTQNQRHYPDPGTLGSI